MKKTLGFIGLMLVISTWCWADLASPFYTGDGGKGSSIAIHAPKASGLTNVQGYLPALLQGEFVSNFSGYSAILVLDRKRLNGHYAEPLKGSSNHKVQKKE